MFHAPSRRLVMSVLVLGLSACTGGAGPLATSKEAASALKQKIAFVSTRDNPTGNPGLTAEIYLMNPDGTELVRLTNNSYGDGFPALSPTGLRIVFESNRVQTSDEPLRVDLFVMNRDGSEQTDLTRGSSASWSPDGHNVVFHRSASDAVCVTGVGSGEPGCPVNINPGAATYDSDIFVANVDDLLEGTGTPVNITNNAGFNYINDDADWSIHDQIVFTRKTVEDASHCSAGQCDYPTGDVWVMNADGSGDCNGGPCNVTSNGYEDRAPSWSPSGSKIVYMCRTNRDPTSDFSRDFEICVMNADGTDNQVLTENTVPDLSPSFSPDGAKIVFHRLLGPGNQQLFTMDADGSNVTQLTSSPGLNLFADWGVLKVNFSPNSPMAEAD